MQPLTPRSASRERPVNWWEGPCPEWVRSGWGRSDWAAGVRSAGHDCRWGNGNDTIVDPDLTLTAGKPLRPDLPALRKVLTARGVPKRDLADLTATLTVVEGRLASRHTAERSVFRPPAGPTEQAYARTCAARVRALTSDPGCGLELTDVDTELTARHYPDVWAAFLSGPGR